MKQLVIVFLLFLVSSVALGFDIRGTVTNSSAIPLPDARVELTHQSKTLSTTTDKNGEFRFLKIPFPEGTISASASGYEYQEQHWVKQTAIHFVLNPEDPDEVITVTGDRINNEKDSVVSRQTLDSEQVDHTPATTADELLRQVAGFQLFRRSSSRTANPTSQGVSLRGVGSNGASRALVLRDGIPLNDPFGGWVYWGRVPIISLDSIDVLRGGGSDLYGSNALSGIINFVTTQPAGSQIAFLSSVANQGTADANLDAAAKGFRVIAEKFKSDGYFQIQEAQRGSIDHRVGSDHDAVELSYDGTAGSSSDRHWFFRGNYYHETRNNGTQLQINESQIRQISGGLDQGIGGGIFSARIFGGSQTLDQQFSIISSDRNSETLSSVQHVPATQLGFFLGWERMLGEAQELFLGTEGQRIEGTTEETSFTAGGTQRLAGVFVQDHMHLGSRLSVLLGIRGDLWNNYDAKQADTALPNTSENAWSPRTTVSYALTASIELRSSFYKAFRAPTLNELYRSFRLGAILTNANSALGPERLSGFEAGISSKFHSLQLSATGFRMDVTDAIGNVTLSVSGSEIIRQRQNLGQIRSSGIELLADLPLANTLSAHFAYQFANSRVTDAPSNPVLVGNQTAQVPRNVAVLSLQWDTTSKLTTTWIARYSSKQYDDDLNLLPLDAYTNLDVQVDYALNSVWGFFISSQNLSNTSYELGRVPYPTWGAPRLVEVGVRFNKK
ncbi:MAG: hypothetical protein C5B54_11995 [Acidobacteria bacterium]|nr:MAG: hypothetical protein C5B54_11995 [Acidobacteriota bacterium]